MAGQMDSGTNKYAHLDRLSTEALEAFLRADIESPDDDNDEAIFHILEVIEQREKEHPTGRLSDVDKAWANFQKYYNTPEGEGLSLYPTTDEESNSTRNEPKTVSAGRKMESNIARPRRWLKNSLIAAAAITALLVGMVGAQAAGIDVFGAIGRWTEETFHFVTTPSGAVQGDAGVPPSSKGNNYFALLQNAIDDCGITEELVPTWYLEGFEASAPKISNTEFYDKILYGFTGPGDTSFSICVWRYNSVADLVPYTFEKDGSPVEEYTSVGKTFYIMSNIDTTTATWSDGQSLILDITGNISVENIKAMIDSIGG